MLPRPFMQLYSVMDLRKICNKLFDNLIVMSDVDIKRELILSIPDIVLDSEDHDTSKELWFINFVIFMTIYQGIYGEKSTKTHFFLIIPK